MKHILFWAGLVLLIVDLLSYYSSIRLYFSALGQVLLVVALLLLIASGFVKSRKF